MIATVGIYVDNQQEALRFWTEQVGFEVHCSQPMGPEANWLEIGPKGAESCLVIYPKSMMKDWRECKSSVVFECADIQKTYEEMSSRGVKFPQEPKAMPWGPFALFQDRDGNEFGLRGK